MIFSKPSRLPHLLVSIVMSAIFFWRPRDTTANMGSLRDLTSVCLQPPEKKGNVTIPEGLTSQCPIARKQKKVQEHEHKSCYCQNNKGF